jgi:ABC-2 type transport system permease protein
LFPLDILPPALTKVLAFTPFPYQLFFPVSVYLNRIQGAALWQGILIQIFWVVAFYILARVVWRRGIKKYTAVGG